MEVITTASIGHYAYGIIDTNTLRSTVDGLFPTFAKNLDADFISGFHHRYKGGHDLLIDVPQTFLNKGFRDGINHLGHIILTDFPTKTGIPIPGFSKIGLGQYLESIGIHKGWLNINIMDGSIGFFAISEGHTDLLQSLSGNLDMNAFTFFDTFVEGSLEIAFGISTKNPFLVLGGIENILAGVVSSFKTISVYVDPMDFFGAGITSVILGTGLSLLLSDGTLSEKINISLNRGLHSSSLGMMFSINSTFGFGLMGGYLSYHIGNYLAEDTNQKIFKQMSITKEQFELFFKAIKESDKNFINMWRNINLNVVISSEHVVLNNKLILINNSSLEVIKIKRNEDFTNSLGILKNDITTIKC